MRISLPLQLKHSLFEQLTYIVPKQKGLVVFYPTHNKSGFSGNLKSFFLYLSTCPERENYKAVWCTNNDQTYNDLKAKGYHVVKNKLDIHYQLLKAQHIIQDSSHVMLVGKLSVIQLWHGNGFKNSALLDENNSPEMRELLRKAYEQYAFIAASSPENQELMVKSFGNEKVLIVGSPKNDVFYDNPAQIETIKGQYGLSKFNKIYAYTPTFRDTGDFNPFDGRFWEALNTWLVANNALFAVKKHPWDKTLVIPEQFENIKDLSATIADVQELLIISDVLISDYSAIVTDFAITGKPIIYYFHDYDNYVSIRSFYYNMMEVLPGPFVYDSDSLLTYIKDLSWFSEPEYRLKFKKFLATFHTYMDGNSSKRVFEEMKKLN
ncbi:MAG: CDP-glycerol:poly(glycerophosphate) glycerophosphotransferase [Pedobacter sp.]|nr:CDP-glycerol:poly(glycerophosphate) glycerophosphotransferase [Pedobacter sp.]